MTRQTCLAPQPAAMLKQLRDEIAFDGSIILADLQAVLSPLHDSAIVIPELVMVTLPAGITDLVVMMIKSWFHRFIVMGALGLLKANETAG